MRPGGHRDHAEKNQRAMQKKAAEVEARLAVSAVGTLVCVVLSGLGVWSWLFCVFLIKCTIVHLCHRAPSCNFVHTLCVSSS